VSERGMEAQTPSHQKNVKMGENPKEGKNEPQSCTNSGKRRVKEGRDFSIVLSCNRKGRHIVDPVKSISEVRWL